MKTTASVLGVMALVGSMYPARASCEEDSTRLVVALGANASKSTWRGDAGAQGALEIGVAPMDWLAIYFLGRLGYGVVDERLMTYISLGAKLGYELVPDVRAYTRVALAHQHEEPIQIARDDLAGAVLGTADGIRHRGGGELAVGVAFTIAETKDFDVFVAVEANGVFFPDDGGPQVYAGLSSALGFDYGL